MVTAKTALLGTYHPHPSFQLVWHLVIDLSRFTVIVLTTVNADDSSGEPDQGLNLIILFIFAPQVQFVHNRE